MGKATGIKWCHHTFNPWIGCQRCSPACGDSEASCYAEWFAENRMGYSESGAKGFHLWGPTTGAHAARRVRTSVACWKQPAKWNRDAEKAGERRRVFCASMADVFETPGGDAGADLDRWRAELWPIIEATPWLDWLLLTKRPENVRQCIPEYWCTRWMPPNIWLGATVESQKYAESRIPHLLYAPARVRWLSVEPMLAEVSLRDLDISAHAGCSARLDALAGCGWYTNDYGVPVDVSGEARINWCVVGGQSGKGHHALNMDHARALIAQLRERGVPVFVKQDSGYRDGQQGRFTAEEWALKQFPPAQMPEVRR